MNPLTHALYLYESYFCFKSCLLTDMRVGPLSSRKIKLGGSMDLVSISEKMLHFQAATATICFPGSRAPPVLCASFPAFAFYYFRGRFSFPQTHWTECMFAAYPPSFHSWKKPSILRIAKSFYSLRQWEKHGVKQHTRAKSQRFRSKGEKVISGCH